MAIAKTSRIVRHALQVAATTAAITWVLSDGLSPAVGQRATSAPAASVLDPPTFLRLAHSSAVLQERAAQLVALRETRPEARAFAQLMVEFRRGQRAKLEGVAREHQLVIPNVPEFEHRAILENLEPLDSVELSRRYAEIQVQALEQEVRGYTSAANSSDEWLRALAQDTRPGLAQLLEQARQMRQSVGP